MGPADINATDMIYTHLFADDHSADRERVDLWSAGSDVLTYSGGRSGSCAPGSRTYQRMNWRSTVDRSTRGSGAG